MSERWIGATECLGKDHQDVEIYLPDGKIILDWNNQDTYFKLKKIIYDFAKKEYPNEIRQDPPEEWMLDLTRMGCNE